MSEIQDELRRWYGGLPISIEDALPHVERLLRRVHNRAYQRGLRHGDQRPEPNILAALKDENRPPIKSEVTWEQHLRHYCGYDPRQNELRDENGGD